MAESFSMEERRAALVAELREKDIPLPPPIERAFLTVPRHLFVPGVYLDAVYHDQVIVTKRDKYGDPVSSSSQPAIMAIMAEALALQPGHRVLEIGTGTGYNAALLAEIVRAEGAGEAGRVTTVEIDEEIAESARAHLARAGYTDVQVVCADGAAGFAPNAPYDRIIATASVWDLPPAWADQLREGGVLVAPLHFDSLQIGAALYKGADGQLGSTRLFPLGFIPLQGAAAGPLHRVQVGSAGLWVGYSAEMPIDAVQVYTLLSEDHEFAQLPHTLDRDNLWPFLYYALFHRSEAYHLITYNVQDGQTAYGLEGYGWGFFSPTSACLVPHGDERVLHVFGGSDACLSLIEMAEVWEAAGRPTLDRFRLQVTPAGQKAPLPPDYALAARVFERPAYTYTLWLVPAL